MGIIHLLDKSTVDLIAAGEAVERPSNVVKELVENSIDAGADSVTCEIAGGGISSIRVTDNGKGIEKEDIRRAFMRHATSKIKEASDLESIYSLGFRGEALASISSVARVELITKTPGSIAGIKYTMEGGDEISFEDIGAPDGTTIIVRDLFYNTPARQKFLKTPMTEGAKIGSFMEILALSRPDISFKFIVNGNTRLSTSGNGSLKDVIYDIYGKSVASELINIEGEREGIRISGFIARPAVCRKSRSMEHYFVNGRYVKNLIISRAIDEGYRLKLMQHEHPFTCFMISIDGSMVDVNVHPAKMEVRFYDEKGIYELISQTIRDALSKSEMIVEASADTGRKTGNMNARPKEKAAEPFEVRYADTVKKQKTQGEEKPAVSRNDEYGSEECGQRYFHAGKYPSGSIYGEEIAGEDRGSETDHVKENENYRFLSEEASKKRRIAGQVFDTYWIVEYGEKFMIIDQHAAHEKVLFEKLMAEYSDSALMTQGIVPPPVFTFDNRDMETVRQYREAFTKMGFELEEFGDREYRLTTVPYILSDADPVKLFREILDSVERENDIKETDIYVRRIATQACKAAVKGGGRISEAEASRLIDELMKLEDPYHCPHGRPTIISFSRYEIEKKFGRKV